MSRFLIAALLLVLPACGGLETDPEDLADGAGSSEAADLTSWTALGTGVAYTAMPGATGNRAAILYGGYTAKLPWVEAWATKLWTARLGALGVKHLYAVQGPRDAWYSGREIGNSALARHLVTHVAGDAGAILVAAHSSGSFVAYELFAELAGQLDPAGVTAKRIVYVCLDGGGLGLTSALVARLKSAWFASAEDTAIATRSENWSTAQALAAAHPANGHFVRVDATGSGCQAGMGWCMHDTLVNTRPHNPRMYDLADDYTDFAAPRAVQAGWIAAALGDLE
jgi:hypothetical protein